MCNKALIDCLLLDFPFFNDDIVYLPIIVFNFPLYCSLSNHYEHPSEYLYHAYVYGIDGSKKCFSLL